MIIYRRTTSIPDKAEKPQAPIFSDEFSLTLPSITTTDNREGLVSLHKRHQALFNDQNPDESKQATEGSEIPPSTPLSMERRQISLGEAEDLLSSFRSKSGFFPYVDIPEEATVPSLSRKSPFLLLAILTSSSIRYPKLYPQIDHEFRRVLSSKVIVEGKKSLDFLQGLLIYIAWWVSLCT